MSMSDQMMLWEEGRSRYYKEPRQMTRRFDPTTSLLAAASVDLTKGQKIVMAAFRVTPSMTDDELIAQVGRLNLKLSPSGCRSRRKELVELGILRDSGTKALTASKRTTTVWELVQ
jgi:hypothetical protein